MSEEKIIDICIGRRSGKTYNKIQEMAKEIDRLQKENKELKEDNEKQWGERCRLTFRVSELQSENEFLKAPFEYANGNTLDKRYVEMNFVSKDKIREYKEVFKREGSQTSLAIVSILEELLKENKYV